MTDLKHRHLKQGRDREGFGRDKRKAMTHCFSLSLTPQYKRKTSEDSKRLALLIYIALILLRLTVQLSLVVDALVIVVATVFIMVVTLVLLFLVLCLIVTVADL